MVPRSMINREADAGPNVNKVDNVNIEDTTRSDALYILKLQEDCSLPKSMVECVISNTTSIVQDIYWRYHLCQKMKLNHDR